MKYIILVSILLMGCNAPEAYHWTAEPCTITISGIISYQENAMCGAIIE